MKNILTIIFLLCFYFVTMGQETKFYKTVDADAILSVDGGLLEDYLAKNIRYPVDAIENNLMGTYIGCIRLDANGKLISIFTVNPISKSVDSKFVDLMKKTFAKNKVVVRNVVDTTDIFVPIEYKIANGKQTYDFHIDTDLAPSFVSREIVAIGTPTSEIKFLEDESLLDEANVNFHHRKYYRCLNALNELIRRNPYNPDLLVMRGICYNKLEKKELECRDHNYLRFFLGSNKYKKLGSCN